MTVERRFVTFCCSRVCVTCVLTAIVIIIIVIVVISISSSRAMHAELSVALNFIISHLYNKLPRRRVDVFREELQRGFELRFVGHWYPEDPTKGSGFRCVKLAADKVCCVNLSCYHLPEKYVLC